jgi:hypothetical protein
MPLLIPKKKVTIKKPSAAHWTTKQLNIAKVWLKRAEMWRFVYMDCESRCRKTSSYMHIFSFIIMSLSPTTSFVSFLDTLTDKTRLMTVGVLSSVAIFLRSIQNMWKLEEQAQIFKETSNKFFEIQNRIKIQFTASCSNRQSWDVFKDKVLESMTTVHTNAPTAYYTVLKQHKIINTHPNRNTVQTPKNEFDSFSFDTSIEMDVAHTDQYSKSVSNEYVSPAYDAKSQNKRALKTALKGIKNRKKLVARHAQREALHEFDNSFDTQSVLPSPTTSLSSSSTPSQSLSPSSSSLQPQVSSRKYGQKGKQRQQQIITLESSSDVDLRGSEDEDVVGSITHENDENTSHSKTPRPSSQSENKRKYAVV